MNKLFDILLPYQQKFFLNNKKRKIWISSRQIGKSFTLASMLTYKALSTKNGLTLCISTGARAASEIILKCKQFAEAIKILTNNKIDYSATYDQIKFSNNSRILSLPSSTDGANLRGYTASCVCIDEANYIYHLDSILQAINPTLSRDPNAELILATTPAGQHGPFYDLYCNALNNEDWYVQHTTIYDAINDGLKTDLNSIKSLCQDDEIFQIEYCCKFGKEYNNMIDIDLLKFEDININFKQYFVGIDVGRTHDNTAIVILAKQNDKVYVENVITLKKMEYTKQIDIIKQLYAKYNFSGYIDQTGIGSAFAEQIHKEISSKLRGIQITSTNKTPMYEAIRASIFNNELIFNIKFKTQIITDFNKISRVINEAGNISFKATHNKDGHSDIVSALTLAYKAYKDLPQNQNMPIPYVRFSALR